MSRLPDRSIMWLVSKPWFEPPKACVVRTIESCIGRTTSTMAGTETLVIRVIMAFMERWPALTLDAIRARGILKLIDWCADTMIWDDARCLLLAIKQHRPLCDTGDMHNEDVDLWEHAIGRVVKARTQMAPLDNGLRTSRGDSRDRAQAYRRCVCSLAALARQCLCACTRCVPCGSLSGCAPPLDDVIEDGDNDGAGPPKRVTRKTIDAEVLRRWAPDLVGVRVYRCTRREKQPRWEPVCKIKPIQPHLIVRSKFDHPHDTECLDALRRFGIIDCDPGGASSPAGSAFGSFAS